MSLYDSNPAYVRAVVHGLTYACPITCANPVDCRLHALRLQCPVERGRWVRSLSDAERVEIVRWHLQCPLQWEAGSAAARGEADRATAVHEGP